jgi:hypothetical protein
MSSFPDHGIWLNLQIVAEKVAYALSQGLKVCLCVGETLQERERNETSNVVSRQTQAVAGDDPQHTTTPAGIWSCQKFDFGCKKIMIFFNSYVFTDQHKDLYINSCAMKLVAKVIETLQQKSAAGLMWW